MFTLWDIIIKLGRSVLKTCQCREGNTWRVNTASSIDLKGREYKVQGPVMPTEEGVWASVFKNGH